MAKRRRTRRRKPKRQTKFATGKTGRRNYGTKSQPYAGVGALLVIILVFGGVDFSTTDAPYLPAAPGGQALASSPFWPLNDAGVAGPVFMADPSFPEGEAGYCSNLDKGTGAAATTQGSQGEPSGWPVVTYDALYGLTRECNSYDYLEPDYFLMGPGTCNTFVDTDGDGKGAGTDAAAAWRTSRTVPVDDGCIALEDWSGDGTCDHRVFHAGRNQVDTPLELHGWTHQYQAIWGWTTIPAAPCNGWAGYYPY